MSDKHIVDIVDGVGTVLHVDNVDDTFTVENVQDASQTLREVRTRREWIEGCKAGEFAPAASVPTVVVLDWLKKKGLTLKDFKDEVPRLFLNDPDNSAFRIWQGRV